MLSLIAAFLSSFIVTLLIIRFKHLHERFSADADISGPQKFHINIVPRIGGVSIAIGLLAAILIRLKNIPPSFTEVIFLFCAVPSFAIGLTEDLTKRISVRLRLTFTSLTAALFIFLIPIQITHLDIPYLDLIFLIPGLGSLLTIFAITGLANAYNIIDGFNGLASMVAFITLLALAYVSFALSDPLIMYLSLVMSASIFGFFIWNYPLGLIFLGDGGAYLIGSWIASLSILLIHRHENISPWFALLINGYPIIETLFTIYRRKIHQGRNPGQPDGIHFHTLIYRRILNQGSRSASALSANARTAPYLWILAGASIIPAVIFWRHTHVLIIFSIIFSLIYLYLYSKIIQFKTPVWMK